MTNTPNISSTNEEPFSGVNRSILPVDAFDETTTPEVKPESTPQKKPADIKNDVQMSLEDISRQLF